MTLKKSQLSTLIDSLKLQIQLMYSSQKQDWSFIERTLQSFDLSDDQKAKAYQLLELPEMIQEWILSENTHFLIARGIESSARFELREAIDCFASYFRQKEVIAPLKIDEGATEIYIDLLFETRQLDLISKLLRQQEKQYDQLSDYAQNQFAFHQIRFLIECENLKEAEKKFKLFEKKGLDAKQILLLKMLIAEKKYDVVTHQSCFLSLVEQKVIHANSPYLRHLFCLEENGASPLDLWQFFLANFEDPALSSSIESPYYQLAKLKIRERLGDLDRCDQAIEILLSTYPDYVEIQKYHLLLQYKKENMPRISTLIEKEQDLIYRIMADEKVDRLEAISLIDPEKLQILILYFTKNKMLNLLETCFQIFDLFGTSSAKACHFRTLAEHYLIDHREDQSTYHQALQDFQNHLSKCPPKHQFWFQYLLQYFNGTIEDVKQLAIDHPHHFSIQILYTQSVIFNTEDISILQNLPWLDAQLSSAFQNHQSQSLPLIPVLIELKLHQFFLSSQLDKAFEFYLQIQSLKPQDQKENHDFIPFFFTQASHVLSFVNYVIESDQINGNDQHLDMLQEFYQHLSPNFRLRAKINIKYAHIFALLEEDEIALAYLQKAQSFVAAHLLETQVLLWACATCDLLDELNLLAYWTKELIHRGNRPQTHYYAALTLWHVESEDSAYLAAQRAIEEDRQFFLPYLILAKYELLIQKNEQKALNYIKAFKRASHIPSIRKKEAMIVEWMSLIRMGDEKKADRLMKKLIDLKIDSPLEIHHLRAQVYQDLGKSEILIEFLMKTKLTLNAESYQYLAKAYQQLNLKEQSKDCFIKSIQLSEDGSKQQFENMSQYAKFLAKNEMWVEADHVYLKIYQNYLQSPTTLADSIHFALQYPRFQSLQGNLLLRDLSYEEILKLNHENEDALIALFDHWLNLLIEADDFEEVKEKVEFFQKQYFHFETLMQHLSGFLGASYYGLKSFTEAREIFEQLYLDEFYLFNDYYFKSLRILDESSLFYALLHQQIELYPKEYQLRKWILDALFEDKSLDAIDEHLEVIQKYHPEQWLEDQWEEKLAKVRQYQ